MLHQRDCPRFSLRIDLINAIVTIDTLNIDTGYIANAASLQAQAKRDNDSVKIVVMNQQIAKTRMYWRAGRNSFNTLMFQEKENKLGIKYNLMGIDYYKGGLYQNITQRAPSSSSSFVSDFDWRSRHGADNPESPYFDGDTHLCKSGWLTEARDQGSPCGTCFVFAPLGAIEAKLNLFYNIHDRNNPHHADVHISEQDVWKCPWQSGSCNTLPGQINAGFQSESFARMMVNFHPQEPDYTYSNNNATSCALPGSYTLPRIKIQSNAQFYPNNEDDLKFRLINDGPVSARIPNFPYYTEDFPTALPHYVVLVGFKLNEGGDIIYHGSGNADPDIVLDSNSSLIGTYRWYFKNSYGTTYGNSGFSPDSCALLFGSIDQGDCRVPTGEVYWEGYSPSTDVQCTDEDNDGYYWWGLHRDVNGNPVSPQLCGCPSGVMADQEDCNDNDPLAGPYFTNPNDTIHPLYSCQPNDCTTLTDTLHIYGNSAWTTYQHINNTVEIHGGGTLTVTTQVFFSPGAKIIVKPQGMLYLVSPDTANPARLTSGCGHVWGGIELWGNPLDPQEPQYQGMITIVNGVIEHASSGIKTIIPGYYPDGGGEPIAVGLPTGGIVDATGATFRDNVIGVELFPYRDGNKANLSRFLACRFETTEALYDNLRPVYGMKLSGVNNVDIKACTFINSRTDNLEYSERGGGLYVYDAKCTVGGDTVLYTQSFETSFSNLNHGIYAMKSPAGASEIKVTEADFNSNRGGIYLSGFQEVSPVLLKDNSFTLLSNYDQDKQYGIYLGNCSGYKVSLNHVVGNKNAGGEQFGIIVNNSGPANNYIYKNYFQNLKVGIQGFNINRNDSLQNPTGLRFICNQFDTTQFTTNTNDFLINEGLDNPSYKPGIAYNQRNAANITNATQEPAGNIFSRNHLSQYDEIYDINIDTSVYSILYTYHTSSNPSGLRLKPDDVSNSNMVSYEPRPDVGNYENGSCPDYFYPEGSADNIKENISESNSKADSLSTLLNILVDAGSTDSLKTIVYNSNSGQSFALYQDLMIASPYLSDTVVKASIEKEEVLPNAMIRDIMVANPQSAKSETLLGALDNRMNPMPDSMWVEILQGMDTVGAKERLEDELAGWIQRKDLYFTALSGHYLTDTVNSWAPDSLIALYQSDDRLSSRYFLVQYYMDHSNFTQANVILQSIPLEFELADRELFTYQNLNTLVALMPQLFADTLGYTIPDSSQLATLQQLASDGSFFPGAWARNILISCDLLDYQEPILYTNNLKSSRKEQYHWTSKGSHLYELKIFPNPARNFIIIELQNQNTITQASVDFIDIHGKCVKSVMVASGKQQYVVPLNDLLSGSYILQYRRNGIDTKAAKLIIIR